MLTEIPTDKDFSEVGENLFNAAWGQLCELLFDLNEVGFFSGDSDVDIEDEKKYWLAAKQTLSTSLSDVQQGVEFFVKGKIAAVSPYILISGFSSSWPKGCDKKDISFSSFRTVDAQDLIKIHNTVCKSRFSNKFKLWYKNMRLTRNRIMHTIDRNLKVTPQDLAEVVLEAHSFLAGEKRWIKARLRYLDSSPEYSLKYIRELNYESYLKLKIFEELSSIINILPPSKVRKYFGFEKKLKSYHCSKCYGELMELDFFDPDYQGEILRPLQKVSVSNEDIYSCFVCGYQVKPIDNTCGNEHCKGKLFDSELRFCLICGEC